MSKIITGLDVKSYLTEQEIKDLRFIGIVEDSDWDSAVLTGSRAFGNFKEDSDIDIFFDGWPHEKSGWNERWARKNLFGDSDYPDTRANLVCKRLNVFFLQDDLPNNYQMYRDATEINMNNGNRDAFIAFVDLAREHEWYM